MYIGELLELKYKDYLIENRYDLKTYLVKTKKMNNLLEEIGILREKAFRKVSKYSPKRTDIEERDKNFTHMLLVDPKTNKLIGGQRFIFYNQSNNPELKDYSYIECYHKGIYSYLGTLHNRFAEVGRTFIMPEYQRNKWLKELIRGFVRIPEAIGIDIVIGLISFNHLMIKEMVISLFVNELKNSNFSGNILNEKIENEKAKRKIEWDGNDLKELEIQLKRIDNNFNLPKVINHYRRYCSIKYEGTSIAHEYNKIMQLLFSGSISSLSNKQISYLPSYGKMKIINNQNKDFSNILS